MTIIGLAGNPGDAPIRGLTLAFHVAFCPQAKFSLLKSARTTSIGIELSATNFTAK